MMEKMMFVPLLDMSRSVINDKIYDLKGLNIQRCPGQRRRKAIFKSTYSTGGYDGAESKECTVLAVASQMDDWPICDQPCTQDDLVFFKEHIFEEPIPCAGHVIVVPRPIKTGMTEALRPVGGGAVRRSIWIRPAKSMRLIRINSEEFGQILGFSLEREMGEGGNQDSSSDSTVSCCHGTDTKIEPCEGMHSKNNSKVVQLEGRLPVVQMVGPQR
ncbi:hypothetical protein B0H17DRAFT_1123599 [Mycena rosella]|uniref:Uncharacterized protein n=1 Tax=Mycena rosella TaxID=1033263 RepID=A0AAD7MCF0_MYCRO|nr:hypothetical protein B0H17DRAFT_1123599 [Mycena rosella]